MTPAVTPTGSELATIVAVPVPTAVTVIEVTGPSEVYLMGLGPSEEIETTDSSVVIHSTLAVPIATPFWSLTVATTVAVSPIAVKLKVVGEIETDVATGIAVGVSHATTSSRAVSQIRLMPPPIFMRTFISWSIAIHPTLKCFRR